MELFVQEEEFEVDGSDFEDLCRGGTVAHFVEEHLAKRSTVDGEYCIRKGREKELGAKFVFLGRLVG